MLKTDEQIKFQSIRVRGQVPDSFGLKDINTPGRARIHQVSSRNTSLRLQG